MDTVLSSGVKRKTYITEEEIKAAFLTAWGELMTDRDGLIADCSLAKETVGDCSEIEKQIAELQVEIEKVTELSQRAIYENAHKAVNQDEWQERNNGYLERYDQATARVAGLEKERDARLAKAKTIEIFIRDIENRPLVIDEFDEGLWSATVESVTVGADGGLAWQWKSGAK